MTDIYPAIRREVEALWSCRLSGLASDYEAAVAALNRRVEDLLMRYGDLLGEAPVHFSPESLIAALLNEEPAE